MLKSNLKIKENREIISTLEIISAINMTKLIKTNQFGVFVNKLSEVAYFVV